jgi:hypothetical protein
MFKLLLFLAQGGVTRPSGAIPPNKVYNWSVRDMILVIGISVIMANLLFLWAYFGRRNRRRQLGMYSRALYKTEKGGSDSGHHRHRHRHKRKHNHPANLPRNPSLAEAGGLPPLRNEEPPPPKPAA